MKIERPEEKIENRPDWQAALERGRADIAAGRTVSHEEVEDWHRSQAASASPAPERQKNLMDVCDSIRGLADDVDFSGGNGAL